VSFVVSVLLILHTPLVSVFMARLGAFPPTVGLLSGIGPVLYAVATPLFGIASGRLGERKMVVLSLVTLAAAYVALPLASTVFEVAVIAAVSVIAYAAFWPPIESLFSRRGGSVSSFSTAWSSGTLAGSLLVSPLLLVLRRAFWCMACLSAAMAFLSLLLGESSEREETLSLNDVVRGIRESPQAWAWAFSYATVLGAVFTFYPLIVELLALPSWYTSLVLFSLVGARTLVFSLFGRIPRALSSPHVGSALLLLTALIPFARNPLALSLASATVGAGTGILYARSLASAFSSEPGKRAVYTGLFESFIGLGYAAGPVVAGAASSLSLSAAIPAAAALSVAVCYLSASASKRR